MTGHDTEHKGIIMTITEDADMDPKPYILTAISIGLEGAATGMALAKAKKLAEHAGKVEIADLVTGRRTIIKHVEKGNHR